jgi:hypothetical protein
MNLLNDAQGVDVGFRHFRRIRVLAMSLATMMAILFGDARLASAQGASCPASGALKNFQVASNVGAFFSNNGQITTYTFVSLTDENPVGGVPGLIKYCVYPTANQPGGFDPQAIGANGKLWTVATGSRNFAFARPAGEPSNIPLDGQITVMGTATWATVPTDQTILLHINDAAVCASIYGSDSSGTCFVKPTNLAQVCNAGDTGVAYNAMPFGVVNCSKPSFGVEAYNFNEIGDEVKLASGTPRELVSLSVLFASYGCGTSGHWHTDDCTTAPGATFTHSITGNIYSVTDCMGAPCPDGPPIATATETFTIPYRPSKDAVNCTGANAGKWFNPFANGGPGACQNSISTVLTFTFPTGIILPENVIWTVQYNTSNSGYDPITPPVQSCNGNNNNPGCPYDSLNVGTVNFPNAPYAGNDVDNNVVFLSSNSGGYPNSGGTAEPLQSTTTIQTDSMTGLRPLGAITTKP